MQAHLLGETLQRANFLVGYCGPDIVEFNQLEHSDIALLLADSDEHAIQACEVVRTLRERRTKAILIIEAPRREVVVGAFRAGIRGFFPKTTSMTELQKCIMAVNDGQIWASNSDVLWLVEALSQPQPTRIVDARGADLLSRREQEVVRCVAEGQSNRLIAKTLGLSENTVKNYLFRIFEKLGISSRIELLLYSLSTAAAETSETVSKPTGNEDEALLSQCHVAAEQLMTPTLSLGECYLTGRRIPRDPVAAYRWFLIAKKVADLSQARSNEAATERESELTREQRDKAARASEMWLNKHVRNTLNPPQANNRREAA